MADIKNMAKSIGVVLDSLGNVEMGGIRLNQPNSSLLDLGALPMDIHVAMQPAAVAYYGMLVRDAKHQFATLKRAYDRWYKTMWTEAKVKACGGSAQYKPTVNDIEARLIVDHEKELEDWDEKLDTAQRNMDTMETWFEAWRQKSFALKDHVELENEERYASGGGSAKGKEVQGVSEEGSSEKMRRVKDIIRRRREAQQGVSA